MKKINLNNKVILITGGTGSLGQILVKNILKNKKVKEIRVYSRDEYKQSIMMLKIKDKRVTYWLGDVRDLERMKEACKDVDIVIHTAALKRMDNTSHNSYTVADVNITGTRNVVISASDKKIIFVSTDKAFNPSCVYGASKMISEEIALSSGAIVWRFGNYICSRGSVWDIFNDQYEKGLPFTITDLDATRFVISMEDVSDYLLSDVKPGLHYPKNLRSMTIKEIADSIDPNHPYIITGLRKGEKMHESFNDNYSSEKKYYLYQNNYPKKF